MIGLLTAWNHITWKTRPIHIVYVTLMFCASVYLDHHYVVDGLAGFALAGVSVWIVKRCMTIFGAPADLVHLGLTQTAKGFEASAPAPGTVVDRVKR